MYPLYTNVHVGHYYSEVYGITLKPQVVNVRGRIFSIFLKNAHICPCSFCWPWPLCKVTVGQERKKSASNYLNILASNISIKLDTTVGHFYMTLTVTLKTYGLTNLFGLTTRFGHWYHKTTKTIRLNVGHKQKGDNCNYIYWVLANK